MKLLPSSLISFITVFISSLACQTDSGGNIWSHELGVATTEKNFVEIKKIAADKQQGGLKNYFCSGEKQIKPLEQQIQVVVPGKASGIPETVSSSLQKQS